jgi:hypothetical protein
MTYVTGGIPVGAYDPAGLSNIGNGHGAIDGGGGYTYFNSATGREISGVAGFTYNLKNPLTHTKAVLISISIGGHRSTSQSSCSSALSGMCISNLLPIPGNTPS